MAETTFNNAFFNNLGKSPEVVAGVNRVRDEIVGTARATALVDQGDYRDGIVGQGKFNERYVGLVVGTDPKTMIIESKTGNLARAGKKHARGRRG